MIKVAKDAYQIPLMPRSAINCYLTEDVLIDAGIKSSGKKILNALKENEVRKHVITHAHADHQGSSKEVCIQLNIPYMCHELEVNRASTGYVIEEYPNQNGLVPRFQQKYWAGMGHEVDKTLKEGDVIGGFTVIETPGHASGHISLFREKDGVLIVGDVMTNMNLVSTLVGLNEPPNIFTKDTDINRDSIKKLYDLKPKVLCFGLGPVLFDNGEFDKFMNQLN
jgi:glyoxylase-like metal-dependent hydrolase (beta-lactamase superfamily II)